MTLSKLAKYWDIITLIIMLIIFLIGALLSKFFLIPLYIETVSSLDNVQQAQLDNMLFYSKIWGHMANATLGLCVFLILAIHGLTTKLRKFS